MTNWQPISKYEPDIDNEIICPNCGILINVWHALSCGPLKIHCNKCNCNFTADFKIIMTDIMIDDDSIEIPNEEKDV